MAMPFAGGDVLDTAWFDQGDPSAVLALSDRYVNLRFRYSHTCSSPSLQYHLTGRTRSDEQKCRHLIASGQCSICFSAAPGSQAPASWSKSEFGMGSSPSRSGRRER